MRQKEDEINGERRRSQTSESGLVAEGHRKTARVVGDEVKHHCSNCAFLDSELRQRLSHSAYKHSKETCIRPGGTAKAGDPSVKLDAVVYRW